MLATILLLELSLLQYMPTSNNYTQKVRLGGATFKTDGWSLIWDPEL